ncbi:MAG: Sb-PDE family phosphodiesterase [Flavobacteriaceae bacterium]
MKNKVICTLVALWTFGGSTIAQEVKGRNLKINFPDIPGYMTLKADFHLHTVFSDGHVWPSFRVREAQKNGLDIISLTEHTDFESYPDEIEYHRERAFEIAQENAKNTDVLVVRGVEISPRVPPYHNNAIFLKNVDKIPYDYMKDSHKKFQMKDNIKREELLAPFNEVEKQGGFVLYNHPNYNWWDKKDKELFTDIHKELLNREILKGVEVANSGRYNIIAHRMAEKYNLTMFSNSDEHHDIASVYEDSLRPMTLVFAKEKTEASILEALKERRTLAFFRDYLVGRQRESEAFFKASVDITAKRQKGKNTPTLKLVIKNNSDMPYQLKCTSEYIINDLPLGRLALKANASVELLLDPVWEYPDFIALDVEVENILVSPDEPLKTVLKVSTKEQL